MRDSSTFCPTAVTAFFRRLAGRRRPVMFVGFAGRRAAKRAGTRSVAGRVDPFVFMIGSGFGRGSRLGLAAARAFSVRTPVMAERSADRAAAVAASLRGSTGRSLVRVLQFHAFRQAAVFAGFRRIACGSFPFVSLRRAVVRLGQIRRQILHGVRFRTRFGEFLRLAEHCPLRRELLFAAEHIRQRAGAQGQYGCNNQQQRNTFFHHNLFDPPYPKCCTYTIARKNECVNNLKQILKIERKNE